MPKKAIEGISKSSVSPSIEISPSQISQLNGDPQLPTPPVISKDQSLKVSLDIGLPDASTPWTDSTPLIEKQPPAGEPGAKSEKPEKIKATIKKPTPPIPAVKKLPPKPRATPAPRIKSVKTTDPELDELLLVTVYEGELEQAKELLHFGANPDATDRKLRSAVHLAVLGRRYRELDWLLKIGFNLNKRDQDGNTPLHLAVINKQLKFAENLLKFGADPGLKNKLGETPKKIAQKLKVSPIVRLLELWRAP